MLALAQSNDLIAAAKVTLAGIQNNSFITNREYCGYLGRNPAGNIVATRPRAGWRNSCRPPDFRNREIEVLASYHTHGRHDAGYDAEVPSEADYLSDATEGVFGFVATPGGRMWIVEPRKGQVRLVCDADCLPSDPSYDPHDVGFVDQAYTPQQLRLREQGG